MDKAKPILLFVEDEALVRMTIAEDLVDAGFDVVEAGDGAEAMGLLSQGLNAALLFTDIRMPGRLDGWDLAIQARALLPALPVIYATGYSENVTRSVPGSRLLKKPYSVESVLAIAGELGVSV